MRGFISGTTNVKIHLSDHHPLNLGYEDPNSDLVLNKVIVFVLGFISFVIITATIGIVNASLIVSMAGLAFYIQTKRNKINTFDLEKTSHEYEKIESKESRRKQQKEYSELDCISEIEAENDNEKEEFEGLSQSRKNYDISTEYTLFDL